LNTICHFFSSNPPDNPTKGADAIKLFSLLLTQWQNKLECLHQFLKARHMFASKTGAYASGALSGKIEALLDYPVQTCECQTLQLMLRQGILKGKLSLNHWPPVWMVCNQLYDNWQFFFAKQTNPDQSNRRSMVQWSVILPPLVFPGWGLYDNDYSSIIDIYFYETFATPTQTFSACAQLFRHPVWC
jgi:hypothetical protein